MSRLPEGELPRRRRFPKDTMNMLAMDLCRQLGSGRIDMNPPYQRGLVWDHPHKEKLIDSMLWGVSLPAIYLRELTDRFRLGKWEMIDGKQRLTTIAEFFQDGFRYKGWLFSEFPTETQGILTAYFCPVIMVSEISDEQTIELYNRLNFCGVPHTA